MKIVRDTWLIFQRSVRLTTRNPALVLVGLLQPALFLVLFGPLLEPLAAGPGFPRGGAYNVYVPGLLIQLSLFSSAWVGLGLIADLRLGVMERLRVTPVSRSALLLGRALRDLAVLVGQSLVLVICAVPLGLQVNGLGLLIVLGLVVLVGLTMVSLSYAIALWLRNEDAMAPVVNTITMPLLLLSGVLLPLTLAPRWLRALAVLDPLSHAVDAARLLFNEHLTDPGIPRALAILTAVAVVAVAIASRSFARSTG